MTDIIEGTAVEVEERAQPTCRPSSLSPLIGLVLLGLTALIEWQWPKL